jgi:DNA primase
VSTVTDEIKSRVDLVELVGRSVALKRVGASFSGLCPFHTEKTPSFYVNPQTQSWRCYGCGKWGTAFDWVMEREHLDFPEALRLLAAQTGVALPERRDPSEDDHARRLYTVLERAQTFYSGALFGSSGTRAREYLLKRGLNEDTIRLFGLGYAPSGNALLHYLEKDGFSEQELQAAGLIGVTEDEGRPYDFFRDRVLFPIRDQQGRTIAFGGRAMEDGVNPKYLNSRDTLLFHKQETLFAFDLARKPMAQEHQVVIVEGYMDAAMAHQHGYRSVVATLGTAVTDRHLRQLRRSVDKIVLCLDPDPAGVGAMWRTLQPALESLRTGVKPVVSATGRQQRVAPGNWVELKVLVLPDGLDPDEFIRSRAGDWPTLVRDAVPVIDFVLQRSGSRHDLNTPQGKRAAAEEMVQVLAGIADPIEQDHFINEAASLLSTRPETIRGMLRRGAAPRHAAPQAAPVVEVRTDPHDDYLLALLMRLRQLSMPTPPCDEVEFVHSESRAVYQGLGGPLPPELDPFARQAARKLDLVERLSVQGLEKELERTRLEIRKKLLLREDTELRAFARETDSRGWTATRLGEIAHAINEIETQLLPERESAGSR